MKIKLKTKLELEYGNLMQQLETTFDWFEKKKIQKKLNSINCLLDTSYIEETTLFKMCSDLIKADKNNINFIGKDYIDLHNNKK